MSDGSRDTAKLLRECDAGIKMSISALDDILPCANDYALEQKLRDSRREHEQLRAETEEQLCELSDRGKDPSAAAELMNRLRTKAVTAADGSDGGRGAACDKRM